MQHDVSGPGRPSLSVLVACSSGAEASLTRLFEALEKQTAAPDSFEAILVTGDAGGATAIGANKRPFRCTVVQRAGTSDASARNVAASLAESPLLLFLDRDAIPAPDLVERHLAAHRELGGNVAVLGALPYHAEALASPMVRMLNESPILRPFGALQDGSDLGWDMFRASNLSVAGDVVLAAGGFDDDTFQGIGGDDVELGLRLAASGLRIVHRAECVAHSLQPAEPSTFAARAFDAGRAVARMNERHGSVVPCWPDDDTERETLEASIVTAIEGELDAVEGLISSLEAVEQEFQGRDLSVDNVENASAKLVELAEFYRLAGLHREHTGVDVFDRMQSGAPAGTTVSIVLVSMDALATTKRCVEALRAGVDARFSQEILVVDNGSRDGSAEWLAAQADVTLIQNPSNFGAPRARNQALALASGEWIAFLDNDVFVPRGWLDRALYHGAVDPGVGSVALCANRASKSQVVEYRGGDNAAEIDAFAQEHYRSAPRRGADSMLFTSLAVMVRRDVMARIGGFDEAFSPWGFEDDDLALRIHLAGYRNRVARDTFVYHAPYATSAKAERHAALLEANWHAFVQKWSTTDAMPDLFDYSQLRVPSRRSVNESQLAFPLPAADAPMPEWESKLPAALREVPPMKAAPAAGNALTAAELPASGEAALPPTGSGGDDVIGSVLQRLAGSNVAPATSAKASPNAVNAASSGRANVMVLGCGRSGTSMVTGMLAEAGWFVGDDPYPPRSANAKGFFETAEINGINEYLLSASLRDEAPLGSMQHWMALAPNAIEISVDPMTRDRMGRLAARGPFAFKDPRFCYTLPAWRGSASDARFVCIFREPADTAASIAKECDREEYMQGAGVDFERGLAVWESMYRRVLDEHAQDGEWLFLHFDQLFTPEGVARLEAFVGAPVASDFPEARLKRSQSDRPVSASIARTYDELCARAEHLGAAIAREDEAPSVTSVDDPELTVLICSYNRRETLARCLASFEQQSAAGRYEIVVVNDGSDDGTLELLSAWTPRAPMRIVHRENGGLAAARNSGLQVARGSVVLLVNDDTIAKPELVEEHLAAHHRHGPDSIILGTFEQPRAALDNALMRVLERTMMVFCYPGLQPDTAYGWNRFWTCNISVSLDAVRAVGGFDETFRHYGCEDTDLGFRLCEERGMHLYFAPAARAEHEHILTFDDLRRRSRTVSSAYVRFFQKHPKALQHEYWRTKADHTLRGNEELIVATLADRARAEAFAAELSKIDLGTLERTGAEGEQLSAAIAAELQQYLEELNHLWWAEGENDGFRTFGVDGMRAFVTTRNATRVANSLAFVG